MTLAPDIDGRDPFWALLALLFMLVMAFGLRWGTQVADRGHVFDERWITRPIAEIIRNGWTVDTAIDFQETKGPGLIWPYAAAGAALVTDPLEVAADDSPTGGRGGADRDVWSSPTKGGPLPAPPGMLAALRLVSVLCFVLSAVPLLVVTSRCGVRGPPLLVAIVMLALLPQFVVFGQIVMGEASFVLLTLLMVLVVLWGLGFGNATRRRIAGPVLYGLCLVLLLHSRPHAAAWGAAVCLAAFSRESWRSWPWWVATLAAGLLRLPLWWRWGGLVSSDFQNLHGMGVRLESVTYLTAALAPLLGVLLVGWLLRSARQGTGWVIGGLACGAVLAVLAPVQPALPGTLDLTAQLDRYQGMVATFARELGGQGGGGAVVIGVLAVLGCGGLGVLCAAAARAGARTPRGMVLRLQAVVLVAGIAMYACTRGFVFDRYLIVWSPLLPIAWITMLPRWLCAAQIVLLSLIAVRMVATWLM